MRIQVTNLPRIQDHNLETTTESKSTFRTQQQDVFESQAATMEQAAKSKKEKAEADYAIGNIEAAIDAIPQLSDANGAKIESKVSNISERLEQLEDDKFRPLSQVDLAEFQRKAQNDQQNTKATSDVSIAFHDLRLQIIKNIKA